MREDIRVPSLRAEFLNDKREVYDALISAELPDASADELFAMLERSHTRVWRERLHLDKPLDLVSVRRALPERTLLLDYWHAPQAAAVVAATQTRAAVFPIKVDEGHPRTGRGAWRRPSSAWRDQAPPSRRESCHRPSGSPASTARHRSRRRGRARAIRRPARRNAAAGRTCGGDVHRRPRRRCCAPLRRHVGCRRGSCKLVGFADPVTAIGRLRPRLRAPAASPHRRKKCATWRASWAAER